MENQDTLIECVIDSHLFGGFSTMVSLRNIESVDDIIVIVVSTLYNVLNSYNLKSLVSHLDDLSFHIEKFTYQEIISGKVSKIILKEDDYSSSE